MAGQPRQFRVENLTQLTTDADLFADALERPPEQRAAFLTAQCSDPMQLARVEELLRAHEKASVTLATPLCGRPWGPPVERGTTIGRYKLLEKIGEGGCGVVWMAQQEKPMRRRVALKIIKLGMDTAEVIARFEAERQALALMEHPNIARVLDAGATEAGRPYFVMELVRGQPITRYCDERELTTAQRLALFVQLCRAIQHAHEKGVIHRDIKPSNILVTHEDGAPLSKVIDFGIAKATQGRLTDRTLFTAFEQFIGTPAYMSPEQADFNAHEIDKRSDVYSLGALLYELLTGRPPFDPKTMSSSGIDEVRRIIREVDPPRPSTRLNTLAEPERTAFANRRGMAAPQLAALMRRDLDWIVLKALEKERNRRYASAEALAADVQRYLDDEPVLARPRSTAYRLQKFLRRRRGEILATTAIVAAVGFGLVSLWQARRADRAEQERMQSRAARPAAPVPGRGDAVISEKSIVVLPLENLSPDPANALFTDGMHAEIIATLSRLPELSVVSRTSVLAFTGSAASLAEIAQKLRVANVITGSVRREADSVRITLELRRAADEALLWGKSYNKNMRDTLALQAEIAQEVAQVLQARASAGYFSGARFMTKNPRAYDLMLKADVESKASVAASGAERWASFEKIIELCEEALRLDPDYSTAASLLSTNYVFGYGWEADPAKRVRYAAEGKRWAEEAARMLPGGAGDGALAYYLLRVERDNQHALLLLQGALRASPNEATYHNRAALVLDALGRSEEALAEFNRAIALDPVPLFMVNEIRVLARLRRTADFTAAVANFASVQKQIDPASAFAAQRFTLFGELPADSVVLPTSERVDWLWTRRRFTECAALAEKLLQSSSLGEAEQLALMVRRSAALQRTGHERASALALEALELATRLQNVPEIGPSEKQGWLAMALARAGKADEAILAARRYVDAASPENQPLLRREREIFLARTYAAFGRTADCVALVATLLRSSSGLTVPMLRTDPAWDPVRDDPGFRALLTDPKNVAPF